jgi:hypothetical protein
MKKIWLFSLLLVSMTGFAQGFEGTITWSVKYEPTDPAKKAQMEKSQQSANDPANQEKMKKLQEQMNTPQMKAMMDANPQMKAQMEKSMKMLQGGSPGSMMSSNLIIKSKGTNSITKMDGGVMSWEILYRKDSGRSYMLDRNAKTFTIVSRDSSVHRKPDSSHHTVTKTGETMKILDYTCTKYIVDQVSSTDTIHQIFWTTSEIKGLDMKNFSRQKMGNSNQSMYYEGIAGVPLRMEMLTKQVNMVMEVTDIKKDVLPDTDFTIPADFKESKGIGQ